MTIRRISAIFIIAVCIAASVAAVNADEESSSDVLIGMPDPSAVWAEQSGYQYFTHTNPDGSQYGITVLPDGSQCDAWELFRQSLSQEQEPFLIGMPDPSAVWAEQSGYQYFTRTSPDGSQYGITVLPDGSQCDSWELFRQSLSQEQEPFLIGMPDPSAVWAEQSGYQYFTRTNPDGSQYGITVLPDGSQCDAWELFRQSLSQEQEPFLIGMPDPSAVWAEQSGYQYFTRTNPDGSQYGITVLPDGSQCDAWELFLAQRSVS